MSDELSLALAELESRHRARALQEQDRALAARLLTAEFSFLQQVNFILAAVVAFAHLSLHTGRRNGKTFTFARVLFYISLMRPGAISCYLSLTKTSAVDLIWGELLNLAFRLGIALKVDVTKHYLTFPNGAQIRIHGLDNQSEMAKIRGSAYLGVVIVDESQAMPDWLRKFLDDVIDPALEGVGACIVGGTPKPQLFGAFYDLCHTAHGFVHFTWTLLDNLFFRQEARAYLDGILASKNLTEDHYLFQTEYLGRWVAAKETTMFDDFDLARNVVALPREPGLRHRSGLDLGANDRSAIITANARVLDPASTALHLHVSSEWGKSGKTVSDVGEELRAARETWSPHEFTAVDSSEKQVALEFRTRWHFPMKPAIKQDKAFAVALVNSDFRAGTLTIAPQCAKLIRQLNSLVWNKDRTREEEGQECDEMDAFLYVYRSYRQSPLQKSYDEEAPPKDEGEAHWRSLTTNRSNDE